MKSITRQEWYGALVAVLVLGVCLTFASPYFLTTGNLSNILVQASVIALLAGGQTFVILTGGVDLAVGALTALAGAMAGHLMIKLGVNPYVAMLAALAIGAAVGTAVGTTAGPGFTAMRRDRNTVAITAPAKATVGVSSDSPSKGTAKAIDRKGCSNCTWLTRSMPPNCSPRYQAKKPSHIENSAT